MTRNLRFLVLAAAGGVVLAIVLLAVVRQHGFNSRRTQNRDASALRPLDPPLVGKTNNGTSTAVAGLSGNVQSAAVAQVSPAVLAAIGMGEPSFQDRLKAITQFGHELSSGERAALYTYVRSTTNEMWLHPGQSFALKNEILNSLLEQKNAPPDLTDFLISLKQDAAQPLVLQDYALQQMAPWYPKASAPDKQRITGQLESAAREADKSYAGTALLALQRIEQENPGVRFASITNSVMELIRDESANLLARITAVQLSGQMDLPDEAREMVRRIASDTSAPETLRISAVGSLRSAADQDTRAFLKTLSDGSDRRLRLAAASALKGDSVQKRN